MVVACENCGVKLSENSMRFHRQVCGTVQKPQCTHCGRRFDPDALAAHEAVCRGGQSPRQQSPPAAARSPAPAIHRNPLSPMANADASSGRNRAPAPEANPEPHAHEQRRHEYRQRLTQLREEIYGAPPEPQPARGGRSASSHSEASHDNDDRRGGRETREDNARRSTPSGPRAAPSARYASDSGYAPTGVSDVGSGGEEDQNRSRIESLPAPAPRHRPSRTAAAEDGGREPHTPSRAFAVLRGQVIDQEERLKRVENLVERMQRELTTLSRDQREVHDDVRDLARQTIGRANPKPESSATVGAVSELRTDLHNLGRHVDVLRDELDAMRGDAQRQRDAIEEQLKAATEKQENNEAWIRDVEAATQGLHEQLAGSESNGGGDALREEVARLNTRVEELAQASERQRKDREAATVLKRDVKYIGRDMDALQDELRHLRRLVDSDRRRIDNAVRAADPPPPRQTPRRAAVPAPRSTSVSPEQPPRPRDRHAGRQTFNTDDAFDDDMHFTQMSHRGTPQPTTRGPAPVPQTYVVGYTDTPRGNVTPRAGNHTDTETESIAARALTGSARRGVYTTMSYPSSRSTSVQSAGQAAPVAHVSLAERRHQRNYR